MHAGSCARGVGTAVFQRVQWSQHVLCPDGVPSIAAGDRGDWGAAGAEPRRAVRMARF